MAYNDTHFYIKENIMNKKTIVSKLKSVAPAVFVGTVFAGTAVALTVIYKDHLKNNGGAYTQWLDALLQEQQAFNERRLEAGIALIEETTKK